MVKRMGEEKKKNVKEISLKGLGGTGIVVILLIIALVSSVYIVPKSNRGVIFRNAVGPRGFAYTEVGQGLHFKVPLFWSVTKIDTRTQTLGLYGGAEEKRGEYGALTPKDKNGINFVQDLTIRYKIDPNQAAEFVEAKGKDMDVVVVTAVRGAARSVFGQYAQEEVPNKRFEISDAIKVALQARLDSEVGQALQVGFITVEAVDIRDTQFNEKIEGAIVDKQSALQEAEKAEYVRQRAEKEKEIRLIQADAIKQSAIIEAEGTAQATILEATAKANGLNKINLATQGMSSAYVSLKYAEALKANAAAGNTMLIDFTRMGGNTMGFMDYGKVGALYNTENIGNSAFDLPTE